MGKLLYGVLVCLSVFALVKSQTLSTPVEQCEVNEGALPVNFYVEGCTGSPCQMAAFSFSNMEAIFRVPNFSRTLTPGVTIILEGVVESFPLPENVMNACEMLQNGNCPVQPGEVLVYNFILDLRGMPPIPFITPTLEFRLTDETGENVFCVSFLMQLVLNIG